MFTNKTNLIVFIVVIAVVLLIFSTVIAFNSIENAKNETETAQVKIEELNELINSLQGTLQDAQTDISNHKDRIEKYQDIFSAWTQATPDVSEAIKQITATYSTVLENSHLYPNKIFNCLEDEVLDAICTTLRSIEPFSVAENFKSTIRKADESRYDNIIKVKIEKIKENGISFAEDSTAVAELREYYNSFIDNNKIIESFASQGIAKEIENLEDYIDLDQENNLAKAFEDSVSEIQAPVTLATSLEKANSAWDALQKVLESEDTLGESTLASRSLLETYAERIDQLKTAKNEADIINEKISKLHIVADIATKGAINSIEAEISAWIEKFSIDEANISLVNDLSPIKKAYENTIAELTALYEAYKNAVESIGKVNENSKPSIDNAFKAFENIKDYSDTDILLSLESPHTVAELYNTIEIALKNYNYIISLINLIRDEIDRIHYADPDVTHDEILALDTTVNELLSLEISVNALNTDDKNYVELLSEARLLPFKNDAFREIKSTYDNCYKKANDNRDIILLLVAIKDDTLNKIETAKSTDEINDIVNNAKKAFEDCFN